MGAQQSAASERLLDQDPESASLPPSLPAPSLADGTLSSAGQSSVDDAPRVKIQVQGLIREVRGGDRILSDVSLRIEAGKTTALIGPSGSGKSTILRSLNRLWEPAKGAVLLDGEDITSLPVVHLRRRVGMLFQSAHLFDGTVADNVRYGPSLEGKSLSDQEVGEILRLASLDPSFAGKHVGTLSGGQAQRVSLARTLANRPEVLLLDEPTSALDPASTLSVEDSIHQLKLKTDVTVVWVSHSVDQVVRVADWAYLLVDGSVRDSFDPKDLATGAHPLAKQFAEGKLRSSRSMQARNGAGGSGQ